MLNKIIIKNDKITPLLGGHPWVFSGALLEKYPFVAGEIVALYNEKNTFIAYGFYNYKQSICFRVISFTQGDVINEDFFYNKMYELLQIKSTLLPENTNGFRLVNADADYLPGLVVDVYADLAVFQIAIAGMERCSEWIITSLKRLGFNHIIEKSDSESRKAEELIPKEAKIHHGDRRDFYSFKENSLEMICDPLLGQKTGYFLDQRDARTWLRRNCKNKNVLNLFSYSAAFTVAALAGEASFVTNIDISEKALALADELLRQHVSFAGRYKSEKINVLDYLNTDACEKLNPSIIVCDPPAFIKNKNSLKSGINAYIKLNQKCLSKMKQGDIIITSSCSGLIKMEDFQQIIRKSAFLSAKRVKILAEFKQSFDHTIILGFKEGEYLKTLVLQII